MIKHRAKRILIFNWRDIRHAYVGGAEVYLFELARRWTQAGAEVAWFCGNDGTAPKDEIIEGIRFKRRGGFFLVYLWAFFYYLFHYRGKYDVILDCMNGIPFFTPLYARTRIVCLMFHVHQEVFFYSLRWPFSHIASFLEHFATRIVYKHVPFLTISRSTKDELLAMGVTDKGISVAHPGIEPRIYTPGKKAKTPTVLYVGRLKKYKSVDTLLRAVPKVLREMPSARFIIAGDGEERRRLKLQAKLLGIAHAVDFRGRVSEAEKIRLYRQAWVFVNPSLKEGWGMTNIEAAACGTPTIAADVPGNRDSVKDGLSGIVVPYGKPDALAEAILKVLQFPRRRAAMESGAITWAKEFRWDRSARKALEALF